MSDPGPGSRPVAILVNPAARDGRTGARLRALLERAPRLAARARVHEANGVAAAERAIAFLPPGGIAVAAGGDGTVNMVARAVRALGTDRPIAILPLGTGNAIAHALGVPSPARALDVLEDGEIARLDVLVTDRADAPLALCSLSAGFEGDLLAALAGGRRRSMTLALAAAFPRAARPRPGLALSVDGAPLLVPGDPAFNAGLYVLPRYAFGRVVHPDADPTDGRAEAVVHLGPSTWFRAIARGVRTAEPPAGPVRARRFVRAELESAGPVQLDGETAAGGRLAVRVEPAALAFVTAPGACAPPRSP